MRLAVIRSVCSLGGRDRKNPQHDSGAIHLWQNLCKKRCFGDLQGGFVCHRRVWVWVGFGVGEVESDQGSRVLLIDVFLSGEGYVATCGRIGEG